MPHLALDFTIAPSQSVDSGRHSQLHVYFHLNPMSGISPTQRQRKHPGVSICHSVVNSDPHEVLISPGKDFARRPKESMQVGCQPGYKASNAKSVRFGEVDAVAEAGLEF